MWAEIGAQTLGTYPLACSQAPADSQTSKPQAHEAKSVELSQLQAFNYCVDITPVTKHH